MSGQGFSLVVPNTNSTITAGAGAADGVCITSDANHFLFAGAEIIIESVSDARMCTTGVWGAVATAGILIGTPATIQASAGGGVQIYAGAGISPTLGDANGPGKPFGASGPADTGGAGDTADSLNKFNDFVAGAANVATGIHGAATGSGAAAVLSGYSAAAGAWGAAKAAGMESSTTDALFMGGGLLAGVVGPANSLVSGDNVGAATGAAGFATGLVGLVRGEQVKSKAKKAKADYGSALKDAKAAAAARTEDGGAGGSLSPAADGPRIHEVAPASIDRECGADMTSKVGGDKKASVDGNIDYKSGNNISMKAFNKVSTSSLVFSAHANVSATMKGLATAKVDSVGLATLSGKVKFVVTSSAQGSIKAPKIAIDASGTFDLTSAKMTIGAGPLTIDSMTTIKKHVVMKKNVRIGMNLQVKGKTEIKGKIDCNDAITAKGDIKGNATMKNKFFSAG